MRLNGKATLSCIGRDIEYRELTLERNAENVWELVSDSRMQPELLGGQIVILLSELMRDRAEFIGTPTELSAQIDPVGSSAAGKSCMGQGVWIRNGGHRKAGRKSGRV